MTKKKKRSNSEVDTPKSRRKERIARIIESHAMAKAMMEKQELFANSYMRLVMEHHRIENLSDDEIKEEIIAAGRSNFEGGSIEKYFEANCRLLIAMRNAEGCPDKPDWDYKKAAHTLEIDLDSLPKRGQEDGDIELEDWHEWMIQQYGPAPRLIHRALSKETRKFRNPPRFYSIPSAQKSDIDIYLADLSDWIEEIRSKTTDVKYEFGEDSVTIIYHGARYFCFRLDKIIRALEVARSNGMEIAVQIAEIERLLEKWRHAKIAASGSGKGGAPRKPHSQLIERAIANDCDTFDQVLDYLAGNDHDECGVTIDRQQQVIECWPNDALVPYEITFTAARKSFTRARNKRRT